jgi:succinyl-CoA synthetase beta subunit
MKLYEYQAKNLLRQAGVPVPRGETVEQAAGVPEAVARLGTGTVVVKAQVLIGGRGKAGGVRLARTPEEAAAIAAELLGAPLATHQGRETVEAILLEEGVSIERELYLALLVDRNRGEAVLLGSGTGGMDIEELARTDPAAILKINFDPRTAVPAGECRRLADALGLTDPQALAAFLERLTDLFRNRDLLLLEINPLAVTSDGTLLALDAKLIVDDNAVFKHPDLPDNPAESAIEAEARAAGLSWVDLGGDIACLVNGAGLAMATADAIKFAGGEPANFLDIGGAADQDRLETAFRLLLGTGTVRAVLVNVFGGIVRCDLVAQALVDALAAFPESPPIVVRLEGTKIEEARAIIRGSAGVLHPADTIDQAAEQAVAFAREGDAHGDSR